MSYVRAAAGVTLMDGMRNEEVYGCLGIAEGAVGVNCGVIEWVKRNTMRWYGHVQRMPEDRLAKQVYMSEALGVMGRGRPPMVWEKKAEQYLRERVGNGVRDLEGAKLACNDRETWRRFCHGHPPGWELPGARRRR